MRNKGLNMFFLTLLIIGAINWGLIGFFNFNLVTLLFGGFGALVTRIIYALVGIAGLYSLSLYSRIDNDHMHVREFHEVK